MDYEIFFTLKTEIFTYCAPATALPKPEFTTEAATVLFSNSCLLMTSA